MQLQTEAAGRRAPAAAAGRIESLDVFRGATIASMILVNDPGSWSAVYAPFLHAEWHGWTFTDTVFPFFLWIVGVSITLSFAKRVARGDDRGRLFLHTVRRSALIFAVGLFLALFPYFHVSTVRIPGVLQRIAVCYLLAAALFLFTRSVAARVAWILGLLAMYWVLMMQVGGGILDPVGNFAQRVDAAVLSGHMWGETKVWDPEGIVSTIPAIATVLFGILAGQLLRSNLSPERKTSWMFFGGNALMLAGLLLSTWLPINKKLWTDSFSVFMAGLAMVVFASWFWIVDVHGWRRWTKPFAIFGANAITVYFFAGFLAKMLIIVGLWAPIYNTVFVPLAPPKLASLLFAVTFTLCCYAIAWAMYRRNWFIRL